MTCPKCGSAHGNDWSQCEGACPMTMSPHYDPRTAHAFAEAPHGPEFSYVRLGHGMAQVTCTCGWKEDPMPVSPFDPNEALVGAGSVHPRCTARATPDPKKITEQSTLGDLREQRELLSVTTLSLMPHLEGGRACIVMSKTGGLHVGRGATEAEAIESAFTSLRIALLPEPLRAIAEGRTWPPLIEAEPESGKKP